MDNLIKDGLACGITRSNVFTPWMPVVRYQIDLIPLATPEERGDSEGYPVDYLKHYPWPLTSAGPAIEAIPGD